MDFLVVPTLRGALAPLDPMAPEHPGELAKVAAEEELHAVWDTRLPPADRMSASNEIRLADHATGPIVPWSTWATDGQTVGMATFLATCPARRRLEQSR